MFATDFYLQVNEAVAGIPKVDWNDPQQYIAMLVMQEQVMRASEQLLTFSAGASEYFCRHLQEERGHEVWIRKDLQNLGVDWQGEALLPEVAQMVGLQYYHILQAEPIAFLGYMAMLEGFPMPASVVEQLKALYPDACTTIAHHAELDVEHCADICDQLNNLNSHDQEIVLQNALQCTELYKLGLWRSLLQRKQNDS